MEQASPLYSHKGSLSGGTPDTPVPESARSEIYSQSKRQNPVVAEQSGSPESPRKSKAQPPVSHELPKKNKGPPACLLPPICGSLSTVLFPKKLRPLISSP